jgi:hypothetical protein
MSDTQGLEWLSRCKRDTNDTSKRKHYDSRCKRYRVTLTKSLYGLPERAYSLVWNQDLQRFDLLKVHSGYRLDTQAFNECERHAGRNAC